uniref:DUF659 domain-containing protein n=1 Tax=Timema monikensis TaxID=170555 RepID=A0A7R9HNL3_9NEOP|nr:unnamed protein product [Timema monikensis]
MVAANIPWKKLENPDFNAFLNKHTNMKIPDKSTLRKHYMHSTYLSTVDKIREDIGESYIWATVDEPTNRCGRYVANVAVGKLDSTGRGKPHLVVSKMLEATNSSTIAIVVCDALRVLWPSENDDERSLVLLTDSAAYMLKAAESLKVFYTKLIHVTCLAHAVHRVAEDIRSHFQNVNAIISTVVQTFDEEQAVAITEANAAISYSSVSADLAYVKSNFGNLPGAITALEARDLPLVKAVKIMRGIEENLN